MGRPAVTLERRTQIVEATIRCIRLHGVRGATMARIAEECGMSRGHVRHFMGNRDELLVEATRYFYGSWDGAQGGILPEGVSSLTEILDYLFGDEFTEPGAENAIVQELVDASRANPGITEVMVAAYGGTRAAIDAALAVAQPDLSTALRAQIAYSVLCLALGNVFIGDIDLPTARDGSARATADRLIGR